MIEAVITYPDVEKGWQFPAVQAVKKLLKTEKIDAMISIWPIIAHLVAKELKEHWAKENVGQ